MTQLGESAFRGSRITEATLPNSITSIPPALFSDTQLRTIKPPESTRSIVSFAFYQRQLTDITVPDGVTSIGEEAFQGCSDLMVYLPSRFKAESITTTVSIPMIN